VTIDGAEAEAAVDVQLGEATGDGGGHHERDREDSRAERERPERGPPAPGRGQAVAGEGEREQHQHGDEGGRNEVQGDVEGEDIHPEHVQHPEAEEEEVGCGAVEVPKPASLPRRHRSPRGVVAVTAGSDDPEDGESSEPEGGAELPDRLGEVPDTTPVAVVCGSGFRSSVAASLLRRYGRSEVINVAGGGDRLEPGRLPDPQ